MRSRRRRTRRRLRRRNEGGAAFLLLFLFSMVWCARRQGGPVGRLGRNAAAEAGALASGLPARSAVEEKRTAARRAAKEVRLQLRPDLLCCLSRGELGNGADGK